MNFEIPLKKFTGFKGYKKGIELSFSTAPAGIILNLTDLAAKVRQLLYTWHQLADSGQPANQEKSKRREN